MPVPPDWSHKLAIFVNNWKSHNKSTDEYLGDGPFPEFVLTEHATSWDDFLRWLGELNGTWCFRGQRESKWLLHTSLDRALRRDFSSGKSSGYYHLERISEGRELLFRFQQQAHRYIRHLPSPEDLSSWFALMQHHGVPTRFLDWTLSPYVGLYFAIEEQSESQEKSSAVWAIDLDWLEEKTYRLLSKWLSEQDAWPFDVDNPKTRTEHISRSLDVINLPAIIKINPLLTDERMAGQQGFFLCKLIHEASFNQILMSMMIRPATPDRPL